MEKNKSFITFHSVRMKNFVAIGDNWLQIDLDRNPTTVVHGHNGACKSGAMLDSLCFALYGKPFKPIKIGELVNNKSNGNMLVECTFSKGKVQYKILRGYKPKVFEIYKDGKKLPDTNLNQETVDNILGIPFSTFKQMVVTGKTNYQSFMDLSKDKRREFVESLLDISVFREMLTLHKQNIKKLDSAIYEETHRKDSVGKEILLIKEAIEAVSNVQSKNKAERIFKIKSEIKEAKAHQKALEANLKQSHTKTPDELKSQRKKLLDALQKLSANQQQLQAEIAYIGKDIDFLNKHENCPTCSQQISDSLKEERINKHNERIASLKTSIKQLEEKKDVINTAFNKLETEIESFQNALDSVIEAGKQIKRLQYEEAKIMAESEPSDTVETEKLKTKLKKKAAEYHQSESRIEQLNHTALKHKDATFMLSDAGIKAMIVRKYLSVINSLVNDNLSKLGLFATLSFDEEFNETIKKRGFDDFSFYQLSEGEKLRVDLSIMLAWRELASLRSNLSINLLVMDEIFNTSMDYAGCKALMDLLNAKTSQNTFIVSPNAEDIIDMAYSSLELKKDEYGYTYIVK